MKVPHFILMSTLLCTTMLAQVREADLNFAFSQLKDNGALPFAKALYETEPELAKHLGGKLAELSKDLGDYAGYEIVSRKPLAKRIERIVVVVYFERRPLYLRIDYYDNTRTRICLPWLISREAAEVLPFDIISASGK